VFEPPFRDRAFDDYLSLGVIEHYFDGFDRAAEEMARCLRPGGLLFLTFPHMSRLRRPNAAIGLYAAWPESDTPPADVYRFALDDWRVRERFQKPGFRCVEAARLLGAAGLEHEVPGVRKATNEINRVSMKFSGVIDITCRWFCSHFILIVLERPSEA
jgi:SAM-dependent methyltransferase